MLNTVGLFGTCDGSQWRVPFIQSFDDLGINWYNPDAGDDWEPWMMDEENKHLKQDHIILFPVLSESLGLGSLGEIGFSIQDVMRKIEGGSDQTLVVLIDDECTKDADPTLIKESNRMRKLVKSKVKLVTHPNVYLVETLTDMQNLAVDLHNVYVQKDVINAKFRPVADEAQAA